MNRVNLLPPDRRAANRHRRARRRWVMINTAHGIVLSVVAVIYLGMRSAPPDAAAVRAPDLASLNATLMGLRQQSVVLQAKARMSADGSDRADFSYLLAAVAGSLGGDVVLEALDCGPSPNPTARSVTLAGVGRSHAAVTRFAVRVEAMHLFSAVRLTDVSMRAAGGAEGVGFRLQCTLPTGDQ